MTKLVLRRSHVSENCHNVLQRVLMHGSLQELDLGECIGLCSEGLTVVARGIVTNQTLTTLRLNGVAAARPQSAAMVPMYKALTQNKTLQVLDLRQTGHVREVSPRVYDNLGWTALCALLPQFSLRGLIFDESLTIGMDRTKLSGFVAAVQKNMSLFDIKGFNIEETQHFEYWLKLNRAGRYLVRADHSGMWAHALVHSSEDPDVLYFFLRQSTLMVNNLS